MIPIEATVSNVNHQTVEAIITTVEHTPLEVTLTPKVGIEGVTFTPKRMVLADYELACWMQCAVPEQIADEYATIDYVTFNDDKLFDTGVKISKDMTLEIKFAKGGTLTSAQYMYGVITSPHTASVTAYLTSAGAWRWGAYRKDVTINDGDIHEMSIANGVLWKDGTKSTFTKSSDFETPYTLPIGGTRSASGSLSKTFIGKIYYVRIKDSNGDYILDWTPKQRIADGVEGFWDNISQTFIESI